VVKALPIPGLRADLPYGLAAARTVRVRADELVAQAEGVLDTERIERVHGMRVATRRLRAVLEIYAPCFPPKELKQTLREVKALADALGARRDPDVQIEGLDRFAATLPDEDRPGIRAFADVVRGDQEAGNAVLAAALERLDPAALRERIEALVRAAEAAVPAEDRPAEAGGPGSGDAPAGDVDPGEAGPQVDVGDPGEAGPQVDVGDPGQDDPRGAAEDASRPAIEGIDDLPADARREDAA
jgi:hypothetical protein